MPRSTPLQYSLTVKTYTPAIFDHCKDLYRMSHDRWERFSQSDCHAVSHGILPSLVYGVLSGPVWTGPLSTPYASEENHRKTTSRSAVEHNKTFHKSVTHTQQARLHTTKEAPQAPFCTITGENKAAEKQKAHVLLQSRGNGWLYS